MDETIDLRPYVEAILRRWWVIWEPSLQEFSSRYSCNILRTVTRPQRWWPLPSQLSSFSSMPGSRIVSI